MSNIPSILPDLEAGSQSSVLLNLLNHSGVRRILSQPVPDLGLAEHLPFPFFALVGQTEMRLALLLSVINPAIGGVLLIGPRGIGKTTAVRSLSGILPDIVISTCAEGCMPEDYAANGADGVCPACAIKLANGESITKFEQVKLIELPLNAKLDDVVGGVNERIAMQQNKVRLERGILSRADQNLLYIDEVNLLTNEVTDAILDAAAMGTYSVRRGAMVGTYRSRLVLIGSMNPEEGDLRPQIMDRFGLRVSVRGLMDPAERLDVYRRVRAYRTSPRAFLHEWLDLTETARDEVSLARELLPEVTLTDEALDIGLKLIERLELDSHRAEYAMFEAARAHAAADGRRKADVRDVRIVAPMALRQRRSAFMTDFFHKVQAEDKEIIGGLAALIPDQAQTAAAS
jgi:magnesium chelatase subunit I